jgi:epsilon-lactone hydrolase
VKTASGAAPSGADWSTFRAITPQDQAVVAEMRAMALPHKGELRGTAARAAFDGIIGSTIAPEEVTFREDRIGGIPGWWCEPSGALPDAALLHFHGGWFSWGSARAYCNLVGQIARSVGAAAFVPDYRLAPEHPSRPPAKTRRLASKG